MADPRALKARARALVPAGWVPAFQRRRNGIRHAQQWAFDRRFHVDTRGLVRPEEMDDLAGRSREDANLYEATWRGSVRRMIRALDLDLASYAFVDVGSGKGPVLLYASELPFRQVIGVEHSPALHRVAVANIERFPAGRQRCADVSSHCQDALELDLPPLPLVLFLCNPFGPTTAARFAERVHRSLLAVPRDAYVLSFNPAIEQVLDGLPWLERVGQGWNHASYRARP